nr:MAG TPA: hypothetical protein [Caudoviricetes sp.]
MFVYKNYYKNKKISDILLIFERYCLYLQKTNK